MSGPRIVEYYFSFISLWSYIGSRRLDRLVTERKVQLIFKPIDLLQVFSASGGLPVRQRPRPRLAYRAVEMGRWQQLRDIPLVFEPKFYPADPSLAHRVLLASINELGNDNQKVHELARRGLETVWANESDIADPETITRIANESGLEGKRLLDRAMGEKKLMERETSLTREAISRNRFGAPMFFYNKEPFWGQDRIEMLEDAIVSGREPIVCPSNIPGVPKNQT